MTTSKQQGVALIQVLLITAIIALIAIQFTKTARQQVAIASSFNDRIKAELLLRTYQSRVLFTLFKHDPDELTRQTVNGVQWNFRGQPVQLADNVTFTMQSTAGLMSLVTSPDKYWFRLLTHFSVPTNQQIEIMDSLKDWIDIDNDRRTQGAEASYYLGQGLAVPRNGPLQHISELKFIKGITPTLYQQLKPLVTIYPTGAFSPALAPKTLNEALFTADVATQISDAQTQGPFTEQVWAGIVGNGDDANIDLHPRNTFLITLTVHQGDVELTKHLDVKVQSQKAAEPIIILASY